MRKNLILVIGPSGSGKDTIVRYAQEFFKASAIPSYTDRPKRPTETEGVEHTFLTKEQFDEILENEEVFAYTKIGETGYRYCTTVKMLNEIESNTIFYIIDPNGYYYCRKFAPLFNMSVIYVTASEDLRRERANARNGDTTAWEKRAADEAEQFKKFEVDHPWDAIVWNETTPHCAQMLFIAEVKKILYGNPSINVTEDEERQWLLENGGDEEAKMFRNPSFPRSLVGVTTDGRAVYDLNKMITEYSQDNNCSEEEAWDFISYNTIGSLNPYSKEDKYPIVMRSL